MNPIDNAARKLVSCLAAMDAKTQALKGFETGSSFMFRWTTHGQPGQAAYAAIDRESPEFINEIRALARTELERQIADAEASLTEARKQLQKIAATS